MARAGPSRESIPNLEEKSSEPPRKRRKREAPSGLPSYLKKSTTVDQVFEEVLSHTFIFLSVLNNTSVESVASRWQKYRSPHGFVYFLDASKDTFQPILDRYGWSLCHIILSPDDHEMDHVIVEKVITNCPHLEILDVEALFVSARDIRILAFYHFRLEELIVGESQDDIDDALCKFCQSNMNLKRLSINGNPSFTGACLIYARNLEHLSLVNYPDDPKFIPHVLPRIIKYCRKLKHIVLENVMVWGVHLHSLLDGYASLTSLTMTKLQDAYEEDMKSFCRKHVQIRELRLHGVEKFHGYTMYFLEQLRKLSIEWADISPVNFEDHIELTDLTLVKADSSFDGAPYLRGLSELKQLRRVTLSECNILNDEHLQVIGENALGLEEFKIRLSSKHCRKVTDTGMKYIFGLPWLWVVEMENMHAVSGNAIKRSFPRLHRLKITDCPCIQSSDMIEMIKVSPFFDNLHLTWLARNALQEKALIEIIEKAVEVRKGCGVLLQVQIKGESSRYRNIGKPVIRSYEIYGTLKFDTIVEYQV